jgi:hypothetical protein
MKPAQRLRFSLSPEESPGEKVAGFILECGHPVRCSAIQYSPLAQARGVFLHKISLV